VSVVSDQIVNIALSPLSATLRRGAHLCFLITKTNGQRILTRGRNAKADF